jgi:hypothetical protein
MKCCICGKEYDEKNKPLQPLLWDVWEDEAISIKEISTDEGTFALCPVCLRAAALGVVCGKGDKGRYKVNFNVEFES